MTDLNSSPYTILPVNLTISFCSLPEAPANLVLESRFPNSLTIKWDPPSSTHGAHKYKLSIEAPAISYSADYKTGGDKNTFIFSKLPNIIAKVLKKGPRLKNISSSHQTILILQFVSTK